MSLPQPLMFTVGMIDQITKPIAKVSNSLNGLTNDYQRGTMKMASGVAGIAASGYALQNALMPAIEMDRALGEVKSLGVRESALKQLSDTSYEFALKYGKSSTEFVKSSYDIQSAIAGLNDADLSAFTLSSNVLAAATKSDAGTITNYMGTMYGIFKNQANAMGKGEWVEQLTGMTATAVQAFKTTGTEMSSAFTSIGAEATSAGIGMNEQMAILGTLQATMSGSEAGTKYKSFLAGVGKAQDALNLSFTDSQGAMLPMVDILNKIKGKYGETIDVAEGDELKKAFGSAEAVGTIKLLMSDINGLGKSINELGNVFGMEKAEEMAQAMTDQTERLGQSWYVIRAAWGSAILPVFNDFVGLIADMGTGVVAFTEEFPTLTKWLGYAAVAVLGLVAAGGLISVIYGTAIMYITTWKAIVDLSKWSAIKFTASLKWLRGATIGAMLQTSMFGKSIAATAAYQWLATTATAAMSFASGVLSSVLGGLRTAMIAVNIAMLANPIGLIIAGITLAIAAVAALVYYWDDLKATMGEWGWIKAIGGIFSSVWGGIKSIFNDTMDWIIDKLNMIPGVDIEVTPEIAPIDKTVPENVKAPAPLIPYEQQAVPNNVVPFTQPAVPENVKTPAPLIPYEQQAVPNNVVPFTQPVVPENIKIQQVPVTPYEEKTPNNVMPFAQPIVPDNIKSQQSEKQSTSAIPSIAAIEPVKSRAEKGGITQQISNANQQKSTQVGTVNVYPAKGETNFMNFVEMQA